MVEGNSVRSTCRMTGVAKGKCSSYWSILGRPARNTTTNTSATWLAPAISSAMKSGRSATAKTRTSRDEKKAAGAGSLWTWTAIDADSKLVVSFLCGGRDASSAKLFMEDVASRLTTRVQITTDGHRAYVKPWKSLWYGCGLCDAREALRLPCEAGYALQPRQTDWD